MGSRIGVLGPVEVGIEGVPVDQQGCGEILSVSKVYSRHHPPVQAA